MLGTLKHECKTQLPAPWYFSFISPFAFFAGRHFLFAWLLCVPLLLGWMQEAQVSLEQVF